MKWNRKWRERAALERALRKECAELRYLSVFTDLNARSDVELQALLGRAVNARANLEKVIYAHDNSPKRVVTVGLGTVSFVIGITTLAGPLSIASAALGFALVANDIVGVARTNQELAGDEQLLKILKEFSQKIREACQKRGIKV